MLRRVGFEAPSLECRVCVLVWVQGVWVAGIKISGVGLRRLFGNLIKANMWQDHFLAVKVSTQ